MRLCERTVVFFVILCGSLCENKKEAKRGGRHFLALLGYLHGYKIGQDYALQYPSYLIAPIVVVPSVNQQQSVNIQQGSTDDNYQENSGIIQTIQSAKIVSAQEKTGDKYDNNTLLDNTTEIITSNDLNDVKGVKYFSKNEASFRQGAVLESNSTSISTNDTNETFENKTVTDATFPIHEVTTTIEGIYPSATYDSSMINALNLTTVAIAIKENQDLPPISDNRWQNFTLKANLSDIMSDDNTTMINEQLNNTVSPSSSAENVTKHPEGAVVNNKGPYPSAWYDNAAIDQLSITTNYYTNESPLPTQDDRWGSYSPMNKITLPSGFRPLAGLYYDGFLHRPLQKFRFVP